MGWSWIPENPPRWDAAKDVLFGKIPEGALDLPRRQQGELLPDAWWRVEDPDLRVVGYGWADFSWGEAEVLAAVGPEAQGQGAGAFIFDELAREARSRGFRYMTNIVREAHPDRARVTRWLEKRGFHRTSEGQLVRQV